MIILPLFQESRVNVTKFKRKTVSVSVSSEYGSMVDRLCFAFAKRLHYSYIKDWIFSVFLRTFFSVLDCRLPPEISD